MKKRFQKPICKVVYFTNSVIATSSCGCNVEGYDFGVGENVACENDNPECGCPVNSDPNLPNCV